MLRSSTSTRNYKAPALAMVEGPVGTVLMSGRATEAPEPCPPHA
uniref:Uncharacterized protein n=1 Tax=Arundo donax TaxID=35708 RepID=A0A0A8Z8S2_ARUDO